MNVSKYLCSFMLLIFFSVNAVAAGQVSTHYLFKSDASKSIRVSVDSDFKRYEFCDASKCEFIGELPAIDFHIGDPRFVGQTAKLPESVGAFTIGVITFGATLGVVMSAKFKLNKILGPGSASSPNDHVFSTLVAFALGAFFGLEAGESTYDSFIEWTMGNEISVYEAESIARTLVVLDEIKSETDRTTVLDFEPMVFIKELQLSILAVHSLLSEI